VAMETNPPRRRFFWLLLALLGLLLASPFLAEHFPGRLVLTNVATLITLVYAASRMRGVRVAAVAIALGTAAAWAICAPMGTKTADTVGICAWLLFYVFAVVVVVRGILQSKRVDLDTLYGAICVFLLLGFTWTFLHLLVAVHDEGAYAGVSGVLAGSSHGLELEGNGSGDRDAFSVYLYYSFVTLTTLGYGDITPVHPMARALSVLEAIVGYLYVATMIGGLVGFLGAKRSERAG